LTLRLPCINKMLLNGEYTAAVIIPDDFSGGIVDFSGAEINLLVDPQKSDFEEILKNIMDAALALVVVEGEICYGIRSVMETGGIIEKLTPEMAGPMHRREIVAGKMLAFGVMVVLQVFVLFGVAADFFSMDLGESPLGLILLTICLSLVVTSLGLMVAALSRSGKQADSISMLLAFLLAGLGGCIQFGLTPLFLQDNFIATLSRFVPQGQALWGFYRLINQNAGLLEILPNMGILLLMAAVFFGVASWRLKWD